MVALSDAEWAPFWISYKSLKKRVKDLKSKARPSSFDMEDAEDAEAAAGKCGGAGACCVDRPPTAQDLACSAGEVGSVSLLCMYGARRRYPGFGWGPLSLSGMPGRR